MRSRSILAIVAMAAGIVAFLAAPANADHTKGKKYLDLELTTDAAEEAGDNFGAAPDGSTGEGAMYLNHGKDRFCLFLDFEVPDGGTIVALHLHEKAPGSQNGGVAIDATSLLAEDGLSSRGCIVGEGNQQTIRDLLTSPDEYYINAHTSFDLTVVRTEIGRN